MIKNTILNGYAVTEKCIGCGTCADICANNCIDIRRLPVYIDQEKCIRCGSCAKICNRKAIVKTK